VAAHSASCQTLGRTGEHQKNIFAVFLNVYITAPANTRERDYLRAILQTNFESLAIRIKVLTKQATFMYRNPGVDYVTVYDFTRNATSVDLIIPHSTIWCKVNPRSDYYAAAPARLAQLAHGAGDTRLHVAVLTLDPHMKSPEHIIMFGMWSTPEIHDRLVRVVQDLPQGLQPASLDAVLVRPVRALAGSAAELMRKIYY
jgi:hypothetical protein